MATMPHHHGESDVHHGHGNGHGNGNGNSIEGISLEHVRLWLHFDGPVTCYSLLGITPQEAENKSCVQDAELERLVALAPYLQGDDNSLRTEAKLIAAKIKEAREHLEDPTWRSAYNKWLFRKHPELVTQYQADVTREAVARQLPDEAVTIRKRAAAPLIRMKEWMQRHPTLTKIASISAGSAALVAGLVIVRPGSDAPSTKNRATAKTVLPPDAPELAHRPVTPPQRETVPETPAPEPKPLPPAPKPAEPVIPVSPSPAAPAEEAPAPVTPAPASKPVPPVEAVPVAVPLEELKRRPLPPIHEKEISKLMQGPAMQKETATTLLEKARNANNDEDRITLLTLAKLKACSSNDLTAVDTILKEMERLFDADDYLLNERAIAAGNAAADPRAEVALVMRHAFDVTRAYCDRRAFKNVVTFLLKLQNQPSVNRQQIKEALVYVRRLEGVFNRLKVEEHLATLEQSPDHPAANQALGEFFCRERGDWSPGRTTLLQQSGNPQLRQLGERADLRTTLTAQELLAFAEGLLKGEKNDKPKETLGEAALALQCCQLGLQKNPSAVVRMGLNNLSIRLGIRHGAALSLTHQPGDHPPTIVDSAPLPGSVNLLGEKPDVLMKRSRIVRPVWKMTEVDGQTVPEGKSGHLSWVSTLHLPLSEEARQIVLSGKPYTVLFEFSRNPSGRPEGEQQGATAFLYPLPTGRHGAVLLDGSMDQDFVRRTGMVRSGYYTGKRYHFELQRPPHSFGNQVPRRGNKLGPEFIDHPTQVIIEDGRRYIGRCAVWMEGPFVHTVIEISEKGRDTTPLVFDLIAPATVDACDYLLHEGKDPLPTGPVVGIGAGGGSISIHSAQIAPLPPPRK